MGAVPALRNSVSCAACRTSALRLFVNGFSATRVPRASAPISTPSPLLPSTGTRSYSAFRATPRLSGSPSIEEDARKETETETSATIQDNNDVASESADPGVPWYLQVEPPKHPALMHEPPPLPDIPEGSPKLMEPLVKFASDELGLDDLNLLDLRELDPPAAIGPDLLMLFGTARSERHLHVSADRLVRWLRGRGIHAKADGLIGRNILKVRLKRKARKEKLLGNSGGSRTVDDGITTGWICVNVGTVGRSDVEMEILDEDGNSTGFGVPRMGTTVVVQMLIESRRQELDLEKLWNDKLRRSVERNTPQPRIGTVAEHARNHALLSAGQRSGTNSRDTFAPSSNRRHFSTTVLRRQEPRVSEGPAITRVISWDMDMTIKARELQNLIEHDEESKLHVLGQLEEFLTTQSTQEAATHLRNPDKSPVMQLYNRALDGLAPAKSLPFRLWVELVGRASGVETHTMPRLQDLFREIQLSGLQLNRSEYLNILRAIYASPGRTNAEVRNQSNLAVEVMDCMFTRGDKILENDVIVAVIEGLLAGNAGTPEAKRLLSQFEELLFESRLPCPTEPLLLNLLEAYANAGEWDKFWRVWRISPQRYMRRSRTMYQYIYRRFADDGHRMRALDAIRWCFNEMGHEVPPIRPVGEVRAAVAACLRVADPTSEAVARSVKPVSGRNSGVLAERECVRIWHGLWERA